MAKIECPKCKSDDVNVHLEFTADGKLIPEETFAECKQCGRKMSLQELQAALAPLGIS